MLPHAGRAHSTTWTFFFTCLFSYPSTPPHARPEKDRIVFIYKDYPSFLPTGIHSWRPSPIPHSSSPPFLPFTFACVTLSFTALRYAGERRGCIQESRAGSLGFLPVYHHTRVLHLICDNIIIFSLFIPNMDSSSSSGSAEN